MPSTTVYIYRDASGESPFLEWFRELDQQDRRAANACIIRIQLLATLGHQLRRPHADLLRDGIYELRARVGHVNYRILYFFHGRQVAILSHAFTKEQAIPPAEIERAIARKKLYEKDPEIHRQKLNLGRS